MSIITSATPETVFVFRISLRYLKPEIWRRVVVPGDYTFKDLHDVIIAVMGWSDHHMHRFTMKHPVTDQEMEFGGVGDLGYGDNLWLPESSKIAHYFINPSQKALHEYDFGSPWYHIIQFEKTLPATLGMKYPICMGGKRVPPPEEDPGSDYSDSEHLEKEFDHRHVDLRNCRESIVELPQKSKRGDSVTNTSTKPAKKPLEPNSSKKKSLSVENQPPAKRRLILIEPQQSSFASPITQESETAKTNKVSKTSPEVIIINDLKDSPAQQPQNPCILSDKLGCSSSRNQQDPSIPSDELGDYCFGQQQDQSVVSQSEKDQDVEDYYGRYIASQMRLIPDLEAREELRCEIQAAIKRFKFKK